MGLSRDVPPRKGIQARGAGGWSHFLSGSAFKINNFNVSVQSLPILGVRVFASSLTCFKKRYVIEHPYSREPGLLLRARIEVRMVLGRPRHMEQKEVKYI